MTEKSYTISAERHGKQYVITIKGEFLMTDMGMLRDALIQEAGAHDSIVLHVHPEDEIHVSVLQVLMGFQGMKGAEVIFHTGESSEQKHLLENSGFSNYFEIKN